MMFRLIMNTARKTIGAGPVIVVLLLIWAIAGLMRTVYNEVNQP